MSKLLEFRGRQFGIRLIDRPDCPNDAVQIISEDDGHWHDHGNQFDASWIDDLIQALRVAQQSAKVNFKP